MSTVLHNVLEFTGLVIGVQASLPHGLKYNQLGVTPDIGGWSAGGFEGSADETNVFVTRTANGADNVKVWVTRLHTFERAFPPGGLLYPDQIPFFFSAGSNAGGATAEHLSGVGGVSATVVVTPDVGTSFLENTALAETVQNFSLAAGSLDGQIHNFVNEGSGGGTTAVKVTTLSPAATFTSTSDKASFTLVWNGNLSEWQILGTPRAFTVVGA